MIGILLIFCASFLWAFDTLIRYPLMQQHFSALYLVFLEHLILILIFTPYILPRFYQYANLIKSNWKEFLVIGGLGSALATISFSKAFVYLNPSVVILLQKLQPIIVVFLARIVLNEHFSKKFFVWCLIGVMGALLVSLPSLKFDSISFKKEDLIGIALTLFSVLAWGASTVFGKKLTLYKLNSIEIMVGRYFFAFIFLLPILSIRPTLDLSIDFDSIGKVIIMVLITGIIAMWLYYQGLRRLPAYVCAIAEMSFPFSAVCINWIFLKQELLPIQLIGGVLLMTSATIIQLKRY